MTNLHDVFKALAPIDYDGIDQNNLESFLTGIFEDAQCIIDSIPGSAAPKTAPQATGRPRSATDSAVSKKAGRAAPPSDRAESLRKEWKEVQVNPRENPLGVSVYRLAAKDRKGAWFARRSVHKGLTFDRWKLGMETEFAESLKVQGAPGEGKIRGIGADKRAVSRVVDGCGKMEVYQLSAQFPGPTTPREFITLLLTSDSSVKATAQEQDGARYYMVVSKPCTHPDCPPRDGYIRGQYESVELIREMKVGKPLRKAHSSIDLGSGELEAVRRGTTDDLNKEAMVRSARKAAVSSSASDAEGQEARKRGKTISFAGTDGADAGEEDTETLLEWLMVTRSDPGGSVPRFMVERGTPGGIAGDAKKFLDWVSSKSWAGATDDGTADDEPNETTPPAETVAKPVPAKKVATVGPACDIRDDPAVPALAEGHYEGPSGIYGMITNAILGATSLLPNPFGSTKGGDTEPDISESAPSISDTSSIHSFHSFGSDDGGEKPPVSSDPLTPTVSNQQADVQSTHSSESMANKSTALSHHEKELRKLEDRRRRMQEKMQRAQERAVGKKSHDAQRDEATLAKLREKHEREVAKQEEKYRREMKRLEDKRANEQRKAEERRKKAAEREEKGNLALELEKARAERDVALKQIDILREQVGELQAQNTALVAKLGRQSSPDVLKDLASTG